MGLFKKKEKKEEKKEIPKLPELPKLPEIPEAENMDEQFEESSNSEESRIPMLPSFPNGSLGNKFSQDTIKEAVAGKKEVRGGEADEFPEDEIQMMPKPPIKVRKTEKRFYPGFETVKETEPIFIRIDKFEEGFRTFEGVKKQVSEIENMLRDLKNIKEKEEKELEFWEGEIKQIKEKIEKIDRNIFSKTE